ncbi:filamentous hemagglutinin [Duganella phyllosphaerae]|uniref:Filamentous hemagglutinin n=2 Tax=Duganella phyllosphaerae TaxID=762836 RepID=A0A1E7WUR0_9BURK|nr:filamentous hemagglutinin [Duganella phyllosphaerae]
MAGADLNLAGRSVLIDPGQDDVKGKYETRMAQTGFTAAVGGSVVGAIQTMQSMSSAAGNAKDGRVTAMAAATAAMAAKNAYKDVAGKDASPSISVSLTYGHLESKQTQTTENLTHSGSVLNGNNINITATGGGQDSNINIIGSELHAAKSVRLQADNNINLLAAQDTESQHSKSSSTSASAGVAATVSTSGTSFGITASVGASKGHEDGSGTSQLNTHVNAGDKLELISGGDTTIKGAVASANQVIATVNGNLNLESLQDLARFDSKNQSVSASGTVGFGASVSGSYSQSNIHNDYASVQEQSGIRAGDGGFQIAVGGNTDLKGAVISSTGAGKQGSSLTTGTLTTSDIANHAVSAGSSMGVSGGYSVAGKGTQDKNQTNVGGKGGATGGMPAMAAVNENDSSSTRSGIGGGAVVITDDAAQRALAGKGAADSVAGLNREVTTGVDSSGKIANNLDKQAMQATMEVTKAFAQAAAFEIGEYAQSKLDDADKLERNARAETDPGKKEELLRESEQLREDWKEDGAARVALHTAVGALAGGTSGALGAGAAALSTDTIAKKLNELDIPETLRDALTLGAGAAVGAMVGGEAGAKSAANEVGNNYLKHKGVGTKKSEQEMLKIATEECLASGAGSQACATRTSLLQLSAVRDQAITAACSGGPSADCSAAVSGATAEGYQVLFTKERKASVSLTSDPTWSLPPNYRADSFEQVTAASALDAGKLAAENAVIGKVLGVVASGTKYLTSTASSLFKTTDQVFPMLNGEVISAEGTILARQNISTGAYEAVSTPLTLPGVKTLEDLYSSVPNVSLYTYTNSTVKSAAAGGTAPIVVAGVEMDSRLPVPVAGYDYAPKMGSPLSDNRYWSGWVGYQSELNLANDIARTPNQVVVKYGAGDGTNGADIISVDTANATVTLWDSKFRSAKRIIDESSTFANIKSRNTALA